MKKSVTALVAAYNEEKYLAKAVHAYDKLLRETIDDYEIIIIDDGSIDKTGMIADELARKNKRVRVVHNKGNKGLGYNYRLGVRLAKKNYVLVLPGENEVLSESIKENLREIGKADLIIPYIATPKQRPLYRQIVTWSFRTMLNILFGLHLKYYNGHVIHTTRFVRKVKMSTNSFAYQAEVLIRLLKGKRKLSYIEVPYRCRKSKGKSSCFKLKNLIGVTRLVTRLFFEIRFKKSKE
jgi:glycosyltransferase involved in cell wall biosynthesis